MVILTDYKESVDIGWYADKDFGVKVYSIVNINDIISAIENGVIEGKQYLDAMKQYRSTYGVEY